MVISSKCEIPVSTLIPSSTAAKRRGTILLIICRLFLLLFLLLFCLLFCLLFLLLLLSLLLRMLLRWVKTALVLGWSALASRDS